MTAGNGNGNPLERFAVRRSGLYVRSRQAIEARHPDVRRERIFVLLEIRLTFHPRYSGRPAGEPTWILRTQGGVSPGGNDIPALMVFFTVEPGVITLQNVVADDEIEF
jgi:hypothetical protein